MRSVIVDRSLLSKLETKVLPAETPVLAAMRVQLDKEEVAFDVAFAELVASSEKLTFASPVAIRVVEEHTACRIDETAQKSWPTDAAIFLFLRWPGALPMPEAARVAVPPGSLP